MRQTVRVYVPATFGTLAQLRDQGELPATQAHAVTPALREQLDETDDEQLAYAAFQLAAAASLRLLHADPTARRRRVVISADVPVEPGGVGLVRPVAPVPLAAVAAIHVDGCDAEPAVSRAVTGDGTVDDELEWYDVSELGQLLAA